MNYNYEQQIISRGFLNVCGIDEAGRGPLAGPLVAAAVIIDPERLVELAGLEESKSLTPKARVEFFDTIRPSVRAWSVGVAHHFEIDTHGLAYANKIAFKRACKYLPIKPDYVLFDYLAKINFETPFEAIKSGDKKILSIAAASILAKVFHDRMIEAFARIYPEYGFSEHKGYGTTLHLERLAQFGPSPIHRKTFGPVKPRLL